MTKILLCHPLFLSQSPAEQALKSPYFPLGLLYLAGYLRQQGHHVAIFDGTFAEGPSAFAARLATEQPDIVGIAALLPTKESALHLADIAHQSGFTVVMGGPDPTREPQAYLAHPQVDLVVHHEGEQTLTALLNLLDQQPLTPSLLQHELGVAYRNDNGEMIVNQPRPPIQDLDTLPLPARDLIEMDRYLDSWREDNGYASLTISTSRGCPYGCEWCQDAVHGQELRQRSPQSVAAEVKLLQETYQLDRLRVVDDVDGLSREWLEAWQAEAEAQAAVVPFEALNDLARQDIPMLEVRDTL